ncbi:MAG: hypothetical protein KAY32_09625 [Candidatus Eisenbacteria sp.]|nr:hypothetical protein [Candidatus Eisenbacteria bacterium]
MNNERTALYLVADNNVPEWTYQMPAAEWQISVDTDYSATRIASTGEGLPLCVFEHASSVPLYEHDYIAPMEGYHSTVSDAGDTYVSTARSSSGGAGEVYVYDGLSGTLRFTDDLAGWPQGLSVSADGQVVAVTMYGHARIWDALTGTERDSLRIPGDTQIAAVLSGDGTYLVTGGFSRTVRLYQWDESDYNLLWLHTIPSTTWITSLAISEDGQTIAAGTWTNSDGGRAVLFDRSSPTPLWVDSSYGDEVSGLVLTPDGGLLVAGSYGRWEGSAGNIVSVYERESSIPIHGISDDAFANVGSCFTVDISEDGRYVIAGGKAVHAYDMGHGGWVMAAELVDPTGVATDQAEPGMRAAGRLVASPNPFVGSARIHLSHRAGSALQGPRILNILDPDGRLVRTLHAGDGPGVWDWDGRDELGQAVSAGAYFVRPAPGGVGGVDDRALRLVYIR